MLPEPYYQDEQATIYCADCREVLPGLGKVDLVLTDPPYGVTACEWDSDVDLQRMWILINHILRIDGVAVMTCKQPFTTDLIVSNRESFKYCWTWVKNRATNFYNADKQPLAAHEDIAVWMYGKTVFYPQKTEGHEPTNSAKGRSIGEVYHGENKRDYPGGDTARFPTSVLNFDCERGFHPTQKPVLLMSYLAQTYSAGAQTILDPFMGSGTTLVAAKQLGRKAIGIELEEKYCQIAVDRLRQGVLAL